MKCNNKLCNHEWEYKGKAEFYTCCPKCKYNVKLNRSEEELKELQRRKANQEW